MTYPAQLPHLIGGLERPSTSAHFLEKKSPAEGRVLGQVARGREDDARLMVDAAVDAFDAWSRMGIVKRARILRGATLLLLELRQQAAEIVSLEKSKSPKHALGEIGAAIEMDPSSRARAAATMVGRRPVRSRIASR